MMDEATREYLRRTYLSRELYDVRHQALIDQIAMVDRQAREADERLRSELRDDVAEMKTLVGQMQKDQAAAAKEQASTRRAMLLAVMVAALSVLGTIIAALIMAGLRSP